METSVYSSLETVSSLQAVDAKVRFWEDLCSSFTPLAWDRESETGLFAAACPRCAFWSSLRDADPLTLAGGTNATG